ncbi:AfsA-related hotdog domain-containing protein [Serratia aquatilis]|uniref:AfsA-related hotdog domain-containing protein n=1 Tax=Serratia aquatilis TaxID=1737515 RepID=A0ABV6EID4_9GAMM
MSNAVRQSCEDEHSSAFIHSGSTIDRKYVHRQAINEVFITNQHQLADDHFMISAALPKSHMYFNDHSKLANGKQYYDPMLLLEVFRQTSICVTHKYYDVPFSAKFIFNDAKFNMIDCQKLEITQTPSLASVEVKITNHKYRKNFLTGYTLEMQLSIDNVICAQKTMGIGWMEGSVWKKLRSKVESQASLNHLDIKPASCLSVGRIVSHNVVIGDTQIKNDHFTTALIVDQSYSPIFDHPLDHVPAMFIIEAFRQTGILAAKIYKDIPVNQLIFHDCNISFQQFCELNSRSQCVVSFHEIEFIKNLIHIPIYLLQENIKNTFGTMTFKHFA